ncbi:MAG: NAD(P) transhydrogenase subunit beta [Bradymonadia bacterium]|jgi:NAD(P) transhydrogenase subunit beta
MTLSPTLQTAAYLFAGILFILALGGLSKQETARRGNLFGAIGMAIALGVTLLSAQVDTYTWLAPALIVGAVIGSVLAARVEMTAMPELVAILHSFVGLAAVLVGISSYLSPTVDVSGAAHTIHNIEIYVGVGIGGITFTGSILAWAKLRGTLSGKPLLLPGRHLLNACLVIAVLVMLQPFLAAPGHDGALWLYIMTGISLLLGIHLVAAIGGADMPVVVSLLNSYSGWAAAAAGFMLSNDLLIVTGALVGSSGAILSVIMCDAMNRSIWNVVFGGFGTGGGSTPAIASGDQELGEVTPIEAPGVAELCRDASSIVIVPGYGMAVAQAQRVVNDFMELMRERDVSVRFAIHPVAGRLPGHMNVLLAEAGVPYDFVLEMDEINRDLPSTDVVLVIGANDIVNPGAETDTSSAIYGMPVIQAWNAGTVVVFKRSMGSGYAGVQNPIFFRENTRMFFGDAKKSMQELMAQLG